jgi:quercetin dioxygenase-like cupin family protein
MFALLLSSTGTSAVEKCRQSISPILTIRALKIAVSVEVRKKSFHGALELNQAVDLARNVSARHSLSLEKMLRETPPSEDGRAYVKLYEDGNMTIWAIQWKKGQGTPIHDHVTSGAGVHCFLGRIVEERWVSTDQNARTRELGSGQNVSVPAGQAHRIYNKEDLTAMSVHVYSPPLKEMTYYVENSRGITPTGRWLDDTP